MLWSDIPFHPPITTLRRFSTAGALLFAGLACSAYFLWTNGAIALVSAGVALTVGLLGMVRPAALRPVFVGLLVLTFPLNWLVSHLLLALVFYCLLTPLGLLFRLFGRDTLGRRFQPARESYWAAKPAADGPRSYFRQS
jgi:hypothetical protein